MRKCYCLMLLFIGIFSYAQNFRIPFREKQLWGFADQTGAIKVTPKYDSVSIDNQNFRWFVFKNKKIGVIDSTGNKILKPEFDSIKVNTLYWKYNDFYFLKTEKLDIQILMGRLFYP